MNQFISKRPIDIFAQAFNLSKTEVKRLFNQKGLRVVRNDKSIVVDVANFTLYQDEVLRIGRKYIRIHSTRIFEQVDSNTVIVQKVE